jgi:nucleoside-diphosphate-sugar epimerase
MHENKTLAIFGGTGNTGKYFQKMALEKGYKVRLMDRNKVLNFEKHSNLEIIQGDFLNFNAIKETITGSDIVICMGSSLKSKESRLMSSFATSLYTAMKETGVKKLIYQAGALNYLPNRNKILSVWLMRNTIGHLSGAIGSLLDHERTFDIFEEKYKKNEIQVMVTLPGAMGLIEGELSKDLVVHNSVVWTQSRFMDVAKFTLNAIDKEEYWNQYLYIA